jgi:hypothetical protein
MTQNPTSPSKKLPDSNFLESLVRDFSGLTATEESSLIRWYARLGTIARIHLSSKAYQRFRNVPDRQINWKGRFSELQYATFLIELASYKRKNEDVHKKTTNGPNEASEGIIDEVVLNSPGNTQKQAKLRRFVMLRVYLVIKELRNRKKSWRSISAYIKTKHKKSISHNYLAKIWREIKHE